LLLLYKDALDDFTKHPEKAIALEAAAAKTAVSDPQTAALITVANAMLNLDEVITKS